MKRIVLALALVGGLASFALAQEGPSPEGGAGYPGADVGEEKGPVIVNWWSWDYGPNAKDPSHKGWPPPFAYAIINFIIFAGVMWKLAAKPLKNFTAERHDRIAKDLDEAARLRQAAEQQLQEYQRKVQHVDAEVDQLLKQIQKEAETEKARIIAAAEEQARALKRDAERQIQAEIERARLELRRTVVEAAVGAAEKLVQSQIGSDDQRRMADRYVADVESRTKSSSTGRAS